MSKTEQFANQEKGDKILYKVSPSGTQGIGDRMQWWTVTFLTTRNVHDYNFCPYLSYPQKQMVVLTN